MFHYFGTVTNTRGDSLEGWQVEVVQLADGETVIPIFADENSTPIVNTSGVANRAVSDAQGNYDFFVPSGTYSLNFYDAAGLFQRQQRYLPMYGNAELQVQNDLAESRALRDETQALADAASNPDANTATALTASQNALDALADLEGTFAPEATSVNANVLACTGKIVLWSANDHRYRVSLFARQSATLQWDIFDEDLPFPDQVGHFTLASPDYSSSGANLPDRILLTATDRLSALPSGDPDGANFSGLQGYIELSDANKAAIAALANQTIQPANYTAGGINPRNIYTAYSVPAKPRDTRLWDYRTQIDAGATRTFTTPGAAVRSLYNAADTASFTSNPLRVDVQPTSLIATPLNPVAIIIDPGTYQDVNLHLPDWVSLVARYPNTVFFEHSSGATRPIVQAHLNHQLVDINWKNTVAEGTDYATNPTTSSARYAVHRDYFHLFQTQDAEDDYQRCAVLDIIGGSLVVGSAAGIQAFGSGIPVGDTVNFYDLDLDAEGSYTGVLAAANNSSNTFGGGRWALRNVRDISGRSNASIGVQVKQNNTHPNELILEGVRNFGSIALSGTTAGNWVLKGNWTGTINDTIPGGDSGFTDY